VHRDRITLAVLELSEKEDLQKLVKKWWFDKGECRNDRRSKTVKSILCFIARQHAMRIVLPILSVCRSSVLSTCDRGV